MTRLRHVIQALRLLPRLAFARQRALFVELRTFGRRLPAVLEQPLPQAMAEITPEVGPSEWSADELREFADVAALMDRDSPLALCLRRSLTRYRVLRQAGIPVVVQFGAKRAGARRTAPLTGHAWLTLDGAPYHEPDDRWVGFTPTYRYPPSADVPGTDRAE